MKCMHCGKEMKNTIGGNYVCDNCGFAVNDLIDRRSTTSYSKTINPPILDYDITLPDYGLIERRGWICPKCGAVLSPSTTFCPFCAPGNDNTTITTDKTTYTVDWVHHDSITGTNSGQYVNPNTNTATSKGE